jgi:hypothetical protein
MMILVVVVGGGVIDSVVLILLNRIGKHPAIKYCYLIKILLKRYHNYIFIILFKLISLLII